MAKYIQTRSKKHFLFNRQSDELHGKQDIRKKPFYVQISHYAVHSNIESTQKSYTRLKDKPKGFSQKDHGFDAMTYDLDQHRYFIR